MCLGGGVGGVGSAWKSRRDKVEGMCYVQCVVCGQDKDRVGKGMGNEGIGLWVCWVV